MHAVARRTSFAVAASALVVALVAGCGDSSSGSGEMGAQSSSAASSAPASAPAGAPVESATVDIRSFKFKPRSIAVKEGGRVKWVNSDAAAHTATADDRSFDTQTIDKGKARMVAFTTAGTFPYHCDFHPFMKGTIVVR
jgi:plastocyanin